MISIEQYGKKDLIILGRNPDGTRYKKIIRDFRPYYYDDNKNVIEVDKPSDVKDSREQYSETYEADVLYPQRYLIDRHEIPLPKEPLRICYLDIEVSNACLDTDNAPDPIMSITCFDNILHKYVTFVWRSDIEERKEARREDWSVYYFNKEENMVQTFLQFIIDTDPDIFAGWNVDKYDMKLMINRMKKLRINPHLLSPLEWVTMEERIWKGRKMIDIRIKGRYVIDLLATYKQTKLSEVPSYSLEYIAKTELNLDKGKPYLKDLWENLDTLIEYNRNDVELCKLIDEKLLLIEFRNSLRILTGSIWQYTTQYSMLMDVLLLRRARKLGIVLPTKHKSSEEVDLRGGRVKKVIPGLHKGVFVLDLKALYPSLGRQFNLSYETIDPEGDIKLGNGICFRSQPEGLIPGTIQYLIDERDKVKVKMNEAVYDSVEYKSLYNFQFAMKFVINAGAYGALAYPGFRLFKPDVARSITWLGRTLAEWIDTKSEEFRAEVKLKTIYADTDSVFVSTGLEDVELIKKIMDDLNTSLNASFTEFVRQFGCKENKHIEIKAEKLFKTIFFGVKESGVGAKKRYAGRLLIDDGKDVNVIKTVGFETKRSDYNEYGRAFMKKVFEMILDGSTKEEVKAFVNKQREDLLLAKPDEIALTKSLKNNVENYEDKQSHVRGAEYANKYLDEHFYAGDKVKMIYVRGVNNKPFTDVICYSREFPKDAIINWDKMVSRTIDMKINKIYAALLWDKKEKHLNSYFVKRSDTNETK